MKRILACSMALGILATSVLPGIPGSKSCADTPRTGDAVYRTLGGAAVLFFPPGMGVPAALLGHTGILDGSSVRDMQLSGIRSVAFSTWKIESLYLGARHKGQTSVQGQTIARLVREQRSVKYAILSGYKSPGVSFRCDGLVEWAYESAGLDIVPGDHWWTLFPTMQSLYMSRR